VAYGLGVGFGATVERVTTEVPSACASGVLDSSIRLPVLAGEGYAAPQSGTSTLPRHPVDRHDDPEAVATRQLSTDPETLQPELMLADCGGTISIPAPNHTQSTVPW